MDFTLIVFFQMLLQYPIHMMNFKNWLLSISSAENQTADGDFIEILSI